MCWPGPFVSMSDERSNKIAARVMALPEDEVHTLLAGGSGRIRRPPIEDRRISPPAVSTTLAPICSMARNFPKRRKLLLGGYFTHEYSLEAAALFNPSMVPHPDQSNVPPGSLRFILSLRATAEGHVSSIAFRSGVLDAGSNITMDVPSRYSLEPTQVPNSTFEKPLFERKLQETPPDGRLQPGSSQRLAGRIHDGRTARQHQPRREAAPGAEQETTRGVARETLMLARSNYEVQFTPESNLSERVLFPVTPSQSNGIEDARFVLFHNDDGTRTYYATYTAYDGKMILPQFLETSDFLRFKFITLNGPAVENKGMALFPRKIGGLYAMLGRQDAENIYVMFSDHLHFWHTMQLILEPVFPWEFIQLGNCGSPIETEAGWLVISHGVGPMRKYCIGAFLLDRDDPTKVIGRLPEPLIKPNADRARRLCAQCRLLMRQPGARRAARHSLRDIRLCHNVRDDAARTSPGCHGIAP